MAALSEEVLKKLITPNARALSKPDASGYIDEGRIGGIDDFDDSMFLGETYEEPTSIESNYGYLSDGTAAKARALTDYSSNDFNPDRVKNTRMSNAILEDMVKHPIDTAALNSMKLESAGNGNITENNARLAKMLTGAKNVEKRLGDPVSETKGVVREQRQTNAGGIDYALIKSIVNECIEQKLNEMAERGLLNEGTTLKGIGLNEGKIRLVDNKGNIFSAKLEYKGNTKDKK